MEERYKYNLEGICPHCGIAVETHFHSTEEDYYNYEYQCLHCNTQGHQYMFRDENFDGHIVILEDGIEVAINDLLNPGTYINEDGACISVYE